MRQQSPAEREQILDNLPDGVHRIHVLEPSGKAVYKNPIDVDIVNDYIPLSVDGLPIVMRGKPGRKPKRPVLPPINPQAGEVDEARKDYFIYHDTVREVQKDPDSDQTFKLIMEGMAQDAAALQFEFLEASRHGHSGEDIAEILSKRSRILKAMSDTWLKRKQQQEGGVIDLDSSSFKALFGLILETFKGALEAAGTRPEHIETVFNKLVASLNEDTWKQDAKARMKSAAS